jgi:hypothetical protein
LAVLTCLAAGAAALLAKRAVEDWLEPKPTRPVETSLGHQQHWQTSGLVVTLDESLDRLGPHHEAAIRRAFAAWDAAGAPLPEVRFQRGKGRRPSLTPDGVNSVILAPIDFEGHEMDLAITVGFSNPKTGEITEADIVINTRHRFSDVQPPPSAALASAPQESSARAATKAASAEVRPQSCVGHFDGSTCGQSYDLQNVLTHEVGHFWGLGEDYEDPRATMFSCTSACEVHKRELTAGDQKLVSDLYAGIDPNAGCGSHLASPATLPWFAAPLIAGATALFVWRRRRAASAK